MIKRIDKCRVCGNDELTAVADLGVQYLTGVFPKEPDLGLTKGPLKLVKCHGAPRCCGLLQLEHSYDIQEMYGNNYGYRSGLNESMVAHLRNKVASICKRVQLQPGDVVVDIGSNDGTTLAAYPDNLLSVGIDPTGEKFRNYYAPHINLIPDFFSAGLFERYFPGKKAKVVTSFSMFYDLENPIEFVHEVASILDPKSGVWVFEQSYMPLMLERTAYDTICHEHLEYYGLKQIVWLTEKAGLKVIDVELNDVNGGSFSVTAAHRSSIYRDRDATAKRLLAAEDAQRLNSLAPYQAFFHRTERLKGQLLEFISGARRDGRRVCGLGASTKGNVILQYCGLSKNEIDVIGDVNPDKFGAVTPGTWISIDDEKKVLQSAPDYLLVFPWHFREFFVTRRFLLGRQLVFPLPALEIVKVS